MTTRELLVERHKPALGETLTTLLGGMPATGCSLTRDDYAAVIRAAFQAGLIEAYTANKFSLPNGVPAMGRN